MNRLESEDEIEQAILEYLAERPRGADTVVGIADWWLTRHHVGVVVEALQRVLNRLTESGVLETEGEGERRYYRLRKLTRTAGGEPPD